MEVKPGYKQTDVGILPEDWEVKRLKDIVSIVIDNRGKTPPYSVDETIELIETVSISFVNQYPDYSKVTKYVSRKIYNNWFRAHPIKDDILISTVGEYSGSSALMNENRGTIAQNIIALRIMGVNPTYVFNWTRSKSFINQLNQVMMNQAQPSLRVPWLLNFYLEVPQKHVEQKLIATVLSDVDALLEALEQQIAKKRLIKQGAMQELLTGKRRLPGVSGEWKKTRFGEITQPRKDRIEPRLTGGQDFCVDLEHIGQGTGILTGHTTANEGSSTKSVFHKGDILFGKLRAYLRKYWLAEQDGVCSTEIWVLASNHSKIIPEFLYQLVKMDQFIEVASTAFGTHMPRSDWNVVKNYLVNLPTLNEQIAIVAILSDMDSEIVAFEEQLRKINLLKQGMMQELLTGKTRLL